METNETNRRDILDRTAFLLLIIAFWSTIGFQIAKITIIVILSAIIYSIINLYLSYKLMVPKKRMGCFILIEMILLVFLGIVLLFQAVF